MGMIVPVRPAEHILHGFGVAVLSIPVPRRYPGKFRFLRLGLTELAVQKALFGDPGCTRHFTLGVQLYQWAYSDMSAETALILVRVFVSPKAPG